MFFKLNLSEEEPTQIFEIIKSPYGERVWPSLHVWVVQDSPDDVGIGEEHNHARSTFESVKKCSPLILILTWQIN